MELMISKTGEFCKKGNGSGVGRPTKYNEEKILYEIVLEYQCDPPKARAILEDLKESARNKYNLDETSIEDVIKECGIFDDFHIIYNKITNATLVFYEKDNGKDFVSSLKGFTAETIEEYFLTSQRGKLKEYSDKLKPLMNPKKVISNEDMLTYCINVLNPRDTLKFTETETDFHPVVVEGSEKVSLITIPFKKQGVTIKNLNYYLEEFLLRVKNHEHLCAVLWTNLIGDKTPYVIYLHGPGGDGKSVFIKMLQRLVKGSIANFDMDRFNGYNMYNKSILTLHENSSVNIMQNNIIKKVSGSDPVKIEGKGRDSFDAVIRGQIIIISNAQPYIQGEDNETRRLCYYTVTRPEISKDDILKEDPYLEEIASTPNEFLNYCRQCYEKWKTKTGLIKTPEGYEETLSSLRDQEREQINESIIESFKNYYEFNPDGKILTIELLSYIKEKDKNNKFAVSNFEKYLAADWNIIKEGKYYKGLKKK
jgi:hypothetical protein